MEKLNFEEFKKAIVDGVKGFLPENFDLGEIKLSVVTKNNNMKLTGLTIMRRDSIIAPTIYLEAFYQKYYEQDAELGEIMREIVKLRMENEGPADFDVEQIRDLESCKDKIFPRLLGTQWNEGLLNERPHMLIAGDLAVTFAIEIGECLDGSMSIPIHNRIAAEWNVTADELYDIALSNLEKADCGVVMSMKELLREGMINRLLIKFGGDRKLAEDYYDNVMMLDNDMYVITNKKKTNGACMVLDPKTIQKVIDMVGSDFYILPSSIHECIVLSSDYGNADELKEIVMQVNEEQVDVPERLSDGVYRYTPEEGLVRATY